MLCSGVYRVLVAIYIVVAGRSIGEWSAVVGGRIRTVTPLQLPRASLSQLVYWQFLYCCQCFRPAVYVINLRNDVYRVGSASTRARDGENSASAGGASGRAVVDDPVNGRRRSRVVESKPPRGTAPNSVGVDLRGH